MKTHIIDEDDRFVYFETSSNGLIMRYVKDKQYPDPEEECLLNDILTEIPRMRENQIGKKQNERMDKR